MLRRGNLASYSLAIAGAAVLSEALALVWWRFWMYSGWPGPPPIVRLFVQADGERSYDLVELDMFLVVAAVVVALSTWFLVRRRAA